MRSRRVVRRSVVAGVVVAVALTAAADASLASTYKVGNCWADKQNFNTRAFESFATRGMKIRRACDTQIPGPNGLITSNVMRAGKVERGALSLVAMAAPPGTQIVHLTWAGWGKRADCRYALQIWAEDANGRKIKTLKSRRANTGCPRKGRAQLLVSPGQVPTKLRQLHGNPPEHFDLPGATRVVQRVLCVGRKGSGCSASRENFINTTHAEFTLQDLAPPSASILPDTPLARGEWVGGVQPLTYDASDNVGVQKVEAVGSGTSSGTHQRPCSFASLDQVYADRIPCPNGPGTISVSTTFLPDGTSPVVVRAQDPAGNAGDSAPITARIDNSPPGRVDVSVEGGDHWRNRNDFAATWVNPPEADRAPIAGITYQLCTAEAGSCTRTSQAGADIARLAMQVPGPGEWKLSLWRHDAAGNETDAAASVPVALRFDPEPPQLAFEAPSATDPTLITVPVTDTVSGVASGAIEISPSGSGVWHALPVQHDGQRLTARIDDAALPAGGYQLRARASDQAGNEASTDRRVDGEPMALTLPLRVGADMRAGFEQTRTVPRRGKRKGFRRVRVLRPAIRIRPGKEAQVAGRLVNRDGDGIGGAEIQVLSGSSTSPEQLVATLQTDGEGRYRYSAAGNSSRTLRFVYGGSLLVLPAERTIRMTVPARTSLRVNRSRVLNGQAVMFSGRLQTQPPPPGGKLVELQARLSDRWQTFRTTRTNDVGRWTIGYRFKRTRGVQRFRFRARLPEEASYPFAAGGSPSIGVRVRGL
jgi:hypothetical protein